MWANEELLKILADPQISRIKVPNIRRVTARCDGRRSGSE